MLSLKLWFLESKWRPIVAIILGLLLAISMVVYAGKTIYNFAQIQGKSSQVQQMAQTNNKYFDLLFQRKSPIGDGTYTFTYDLYLKNPYIDSGTLNQQLNNFVTSVKTKYNSTKTTVRSIGIRLYDRKIVWDMGLTPRLLAQYSIDPDYAQEHSNDNSGSADFNQQIIQAGGDPDDITSDTTLAPMALAWQQTNAQGSSINYNNYTLTTSGTAQYTTDNISSPLSDKEFAFWLKMKEYEAAIGTNNIDGATRLYLNYDLNGELNDRSLEYVENDFENFDNRETNMGDTTNYFPNQILLRLQLAIYRPQLLYFILSDGKMVKSYTEAQKKIIQLDPADYTQIIQNHDQQAAKNVDKFGRVNYYQTKQDEQWVNTDPFVSLIGKYQADFPSFSRTNYSPSLTGNNVFYAQQYINSGGM